MKLSIIVPVYNGSGTLRHLVASVCKQTLRDWELILVDDGSSDVSPVLCDNLSAQDSGIRVIHKQNGGVSSARNAGLAVARGDWIGFVDCDDCPKPDMYASLITAAEQNSCDFAMGGYEKVSDTGAFPVSLHNDGLLQDNQIKKIIYSMAFWNAYLEKESLPTIYGSVWPNLYRSEIIRTRGITFPEQISLGEDLLFNLSYLQHVERAIMIDKPLYEYNIANQSATRKRNPHLWSQYVSLAEQVNHMLLAAYGEEEDLQYNIQRQYLNYAINVAEEQICVFLKGKEMRAALKRLCNDEHLRKASDYIMKRGKNKKDRMQAWLLSKQQAFLLSLWLDKR